MSSSAVNPYAVHDRQKGGLNNPANLYDDEIGLRVWRYYRASAAVEKGEVVIVLSNFNVQPITTTRADGLNVGEAVAMSDVPAGSYGYFQTEGIGEAELAANIPANAALYTSATTGRLDDDSNNQTRIFGIRPLEASGGSARMVRVMLSRPHNHD